MYKLEFKKIPVFLLSFFLVFGIFVNGVLVEKGMEGRTTDLTKGRIAVAEPYNSGRVSVVDIYGEAQNKIGVAEKMLQLCQTNALSLHTLQHSQILNLNQPASCFQFNPEIQNSNMPKEISVIFRPINILGVKILSGNQKFSPQLLPRVSLPMATLVIPVLVAIIFLFWSGRALDSLKNLKNKFVLSRIYRKITFINLNILRC